MPYAPSRELLQRLRRVLAAHRRAAPSAADPRFEPIDLPGGHARFRSVGLPVIGVLVLVASWTVGISYYFHQRSAEQLFLNEQREKAERAALMVRAAILADYRNLELSTRMLAERPDLVAVLQSPEGDDAVRSWAQRSRRFGGDAAVEIYNAGGQLIERVGNPAQYRLDGPMKAQLVRDALQGRDGLVVDDNEGGLTLRAAAPVLARHRIVGGVIAEQRIDADYLGLLASRVGLSVNLVTSGREQ